MDSEAKFAIGQVVRHKLFDYRGAIVDADPVFLGTDEWYQEMAKSRPPKDRPWYHVLVDNADYQTYVAERNLESDPSPSPINHPLVSMVFTEFREGAYVGKNRPS
ncbi:MAG: heat shock protein HspQ [Gammaproteobacteria bacterium]|nr:heat shock protein HspQ [Gammaproteobacteria bacterium]